MGSKAQLTIRVFSSRGASRIQYTSSGKYVSFTTAGLSNELAKQPVMPTTSLDGFWQEVIGLVVADIEAP